MNRRNGEDNDDYDNREEDLFILNDDEIQGEAILGKKKFKGRCRICGKIGNNGVDFFFNPKKNIQEEPMWEANRNLLVPMEAILVEYSIISRDQGIFRITLKYYRSIPT